MMALVMEELRRLCGRRSVIAGAALVAVILTLSVLANGLWEENSWVPEQVHRQYLAYLKAQGQDIQRVMARDTGMHGYEYHGAEAIGIDRWLAQAYEGLLTDEKIAAMAERCGYLPVRYRAGAADAGYDDQLFGNYINTFLDDNGLTAGEAYDELGIVTAAETVPLGESPIQGYLRHNVMAEESEESSTEVLFGYVRGWQVFEQDFGTVAVALMLFIIVAIAPIFSEEYVLHTAPMLLTTVHGKRRDIAARFVAACVFSVGVVTLGMLWVFLLIGRDYGYGGLECTAGLLDGSWYFWGNFWMGDILMAPIWKYLLVAYLYLLLGAIALTAVGLALSAMCHRIYTVVVLEILAYVLPIGIYYLATVLRLPGRWQMWIRRLLVATPLYATDAYLVGQSTGIGMAIVRAVVFLAITLPCGVMAWRRWRRCRVA